MDFIEVIMPIIVFAIWIAATIAGQGKKKRQSTNSQGRPAGVPTTARPSLFEEFKRSIKTVVEEMQEQSRTDAPLPEYYSEETVTERASVESYVPESVEETDRKTSKPAKPQKVPLVVNKPALVFTAVAPKKKILTPEEVRQGFILSEILAPPLALREK